MKKISIILILLVLICFMGYQYVFHNKRNIQTEKTNFIVNLNSLEKEFMKSQDDFNKKYLDKTIELRGVITELDLANDAIIIDEKIFVTFANKSNIGLKTNQEIKIKSRFIGYDDLLENFRFDNAYIIPKK